LKTFPARRALWDRPGATPDGYTISHGSTPTHVFNGAIFKLPFDVENDFQPISPIASGPLLIVAKKAVAAMT
jgi:tripartite-type tricarboxylate transporter receptor subunit TctC